MLTIQLLGGFKLIAQGEPIAGLLRPRGKSLLAYLLLHHPTPQDRAHLAYTFWPETSDRQARTNLRRELHQLRQLSPRFDVLLLSAGQSVQWQMPADSTLDVTEFTRLLAAAEQATDQATRKAHYQAAIDCYHGDLLPGLYDDWVLAKREELRQAYIRALETLTALLITDREYATATILTQRLLQYDPLYEAGYVQLMELYALQQDRARALHTYHSCVTVLERELGVPPGAAIEALYQRLMQAAPRPETTHVITTAAIQLVGRKAAWQTLLGAWRRATQGHAHMLLIEGEAGIGKTRLGEELLEWTNRQGIGTARTRSYAAEGSLAYTPVIEWLRTPPLRAAIADLDTPWRTEVARLLPELLTAEPQLPRPEPLTERWQRQRLFDALARAVTADERPKLLLIDDLQWCDQETLEWLRFLLRFAPDAPLLVLGTVRTEEVEADHPLHALTRELRVSAQLTTVELKPLSATETAELATQVSDTQLDSAAVDHLVQASEGNPLFIVEMAQSGGWAAPTAGAQTLVGNGQTLPPKVYAVIQHRLAQLSAEARRLIALAATIGRTFTFDVLVAASTQDEDAIVTALDELWRRRMVREQGTHEYDFSHDRIRDVAYAEISPVQRPLLHKRIALALEEQYKQDLDAVSVQLAAHYERAGLATPAILFYHRAAVVEAQLLAHANAIAYLDLGLALLRQQPHTVERVQQELTFLLTKAYSLAVVHGFSVPGIAAICTELETCLPQIEDDQLRCHAYQRLRGFYGASGQLAQSHQYAKHLLEVAQRLDNPTYQLGAYQANGIVNLQLGHFSTGRYYMEQGVDLYAKHGESTNRHALSDTNMVGLQCNLALTLWLLGYPDQAHHKATAAMAFAEELQDPFHITIALFFASMIYRYHHAVELTADAAQQMLALDAQYSFPLTHASGLVIDGWALAQQGERMAGIARMRAGIDEMNAMNHAMFQTHRLAWLAEAQMQADDWAAAATTLDEAFAMSDNSGQRSADAELHRLRGEWVCQATGAEPATEVLAAAERAFQQAITIAREQEAKSFELRSTTSLCRLWQRQGKSREAHHALMDIYSWFTEGFDTHDLRTAQTLLTALQQR